MENDRKKRMLITGISGLLGNNLAFCLKDSYDILGVYHTHNVQMQGVKTCAADLALREGLVTPIREFEPEIIVHCVAQADVDRCEQYPQEAERTNVLATQNLMSHFNGHFVKMVYISTDLVYDGVTGNYSEDDPVNPLNWYGRTKFKAENEVLKREGSLVLRTNFFGWNIQDKYSLGEWVIHALSRKEKIQGFTDCIFSTIYTFELAKILDLAIKKDLCGVYNCASSTSISKYQFILEIASRLGLDKNLVKPISIDDFGFRAKRSKNLNFNTDKLARNLLIDIPPIDHSIDRFVEDFKKGIPGIIKSNRFSQDVYPVLPDIIPYGRQSIDEDDIAAVTAVLKSGNLTQGPKISEFESQLCRSTDASFAVAVNSGTSALHIACLAAGIGPKDEVITSPNTFVASANCVAYCGGKPVFADIDPRTYNISARGIEKKINKHTKAVIPVHFAGQSCDMEAIKDVVVFNEKKYGHRIYIVEDACHALGSYYKKTRVGSCAFSDMAVMSFHPVKHITTAEGGAVLTNNKEFQQKMIRFRSHGITGDPDEFFYKDNAFEEFQGQSRKRLRRNWYYEQSFLGYNYRITDIQCALGISQFNKIDKFRKRRSQIVDRYNEAFKNVAEITIPFEEDFCDSNFHLYVLQFDFEKIGITRPEIIMVLKEKGIQTQVHYIPVYTQPFYRQTFQTHWGDCPNAEDYYKKCLSIPLHPAITDKEVDKIILNIKESIGKK